MGDQICRRVACGRDLETAQLVEDRQSSNPYLGCETVEVSTVAIGSRTKCFMDGNPALCKPGLDEQFERFRRTVIGDAPSQEYDPRIEPYRGRSLSNYQKHEVSYTSPRKPAAPSRKDDYLRRQWLHL
jgi:hypothetical protein